MARMPVDLDSILEDGGLAALADDQLSVSGQPQADPREQQSPQLQRKEVAQQLNDERQPACCDARKELEDMRAQMETIKAQVENMEAQIQDLIQVIIGCRQDGTETRSIDLHFP
ncbi:hypothetical protein M441DRAFT_26636 [Trichoderma asperellum CBS 433.97]|uniref:Uncharacterized protein n=2 Tax=Trichoderma asperellum TaxID=101201 RepID=A0A2T3Z9D4_TRIA4|nr:hypothetical protein M441DRAFT_26636 [Trichoderma asperellum CBS 433.97]PTB41423.1 hypothetical protein M441DRAFT_26636 [Trichoderma asperellum CBS 433.97]